MNLTTTAAICSSTGVLAAAVVTLRHNRRVFAWNRRNRLTDDAAKDLDDVDRYLKDVHELLCRFAQKPSTAADLGPLRTLRHVIEGYAGRPGVLRTELQDIVARCDAYLGTALKSPVSGPRSDLMVAAMEQEQARTRLAASVSGAQQRVRTLRRP
ncbi:hypothetical protein DMB38_18120 [Streptomyces sp. WAC 06738]|uniref:hypothetical protein n=1 Tax=Streptomyces sp. WAC 06738 TaxID=2203210 RepID=UPI000F6B5805|nr:hypothetical protein [Streptomyces sp. WAC 06738]AZM47451.1 hypothetical protein DMB38_18120 [Streptomyces sp. WAC 06738]